MCELAADQTSSWLMVDPWEAIQPEYMPTALVLDHFEHEINDVLGGAERPDGSRVHVRIALLAGADLIQTMSYVHFLAHYYHFGGTNSLSLEPPEFGVRKI
jgi:nicotinamide mononucleotide adenylyltransferase